MRSGVTVTACIERNRAAKYNPQGLRGKVPDFIFFVTNPTF